MNPDLKASLSFNFMPRLEVVVRLDDSQFKALTGLIGQKANEIMSQLSQLIADLEVSVESAIQRVQEDVGALTMQIAELEEKVAAGEASPEDLAALQALKAKVDGIDPINPATLPAS